LLVLDATVSVTSVSGTREIPIREFFVDFQCTDVAPDELVTRIAIPRQRPGAPGRFLKFSSLSVNDWPCASVSALAMRSDGATEVRLGLAGLAPTSMYLAFDLEPRMDDQDAVDAALDIADSAMDPIPDIRGSAGYKARVGRVIVEQAVREVVKELQHG
jgi:carbon-monoxide dehydrogenase medium subunit